MDVNLVRSMLYIMYMLFIHVLYVFMVFLHSFSKPDMKTWLVVPEGEEIIHPGDYTLYNIQALLK